MRVHGRYAVFRNDRPHRPTLQVTATGVSILLRAGFSDVRNLLGGMTPWEALNLPVQR